MDTLIKGFLTVVIGAAAIAAPADAPQGATETPDIPAPRIDEQYIMPVIVWPTPTPLVPLMVPRVASCSCVEGAKRMLGLTGQTWGTAAQNEPNATEPAPGMIVLTREGKTDWLKENVGHMAVIVQVDADGWLTIKECNYITCQCSARRIHRDDPVIRGYWIPPPKSVQ